MLQPEQLRDSNLTVVGCRGQTGGGPGLISLPVRLHMETNGQYQETFEAKAFRVCDQPHVVMHVCKSSVWKVQAGRSMFKVIHECKRSETNKRLVIRLILGPENRNKSHLLENTLMKPPCHMGTEGGSLSEGAMAITFPLLG